MCVCVCVCVCVCLLARMRVFASRRLCLLFPHTITFPQMLRARSALKPRLCRFGETKWKKPAGIDPDIQQHCFLQLHCVISRQNVARAARAFLQRWLDVRMSLSLA